VVVDALIVTVDIKTAFLLLNPAPHFLVHHFQVLHHGLPSADRGAGAKHRLLIPHLFAVVDRPVGQPMACCLIFVLLKDLQTLHLR